LNTSEVLEILKKYGVDVEKFKERVKQYAQKVDKSESLVLSLLLEIMGLTFPERVVSIEDAVKFVGQSAETYDLGAIVVENLGFVGVKGVVVSMNTGSYHACPVCKHKLVNIVKSVDPVSGKVVVTGDCPVGDGKGLTAIYIALSRSMEGDFVSYGVFVPDGFSGEVEISSGHGGRNYPVYDSDLTAVSRLPGIRDKVVIFGYFYAVRVKGSSQVRYAIEPTLMVIVGKNDMDFAEFFKPQASGQVPAQSVTEVFAPVPFSSQPSPLPAQQEEPYKKMVPVVQEALRDAGTVEEVLEYLRAKGFPDATESDVAKALADLGYKLVEGKIRR